MSVTTVQYKLTATFPKKDSRVLWSGNYKNGPIGVNENVLTKCSLYIARKFTQQTGIIHFTRNNTITGTAIVDGDEWTCKYENYGWTLSSDTNDLKGGYFGILLGKLCKGNVSDIVFKEFQGSVEIYPFAKLSSKTETNATTIDEGPKPTVEPDESSSESSSSDNGFDDLFG